MKDVWAADELEALLETVQEGKTAKMGGLIQLVKQLRAVLDSDSAAQKQGKGSKRKAHEAETKENGDVEMNGDETPKVKKGKKTKVAKEGKEVKVKKSKA
jgi:hypothetical protein